MSAGDESGSQDFGEEQIYVPTPEELEQGIKFRTHRRSRELPDSDKASRKPTLRQKLIARFREGAGSGRTEAPAPPRYRDVDTSPFVSPMESEVAAPIGETKPGIRRIVVPQRTQAPAPSPTARKQVQPGPDEARRRAESNGHRMSEFEEQRVNSRDFYARCLDCNAQARAVFEVEDGWGDSAGRWRYLDRAIDYTCH